MRKRRRHYDVEEAYRDRTHTVIAYDARESILLLNRALVSGVRLTTGEIYSGLDQTIDHMAWLMSGEAAEHTDLYRVGGVDPHTGLTATMRGITICEGGIVSWTWR